MQLLNIVYFKFIPCYQWSHISVEIISDSVLSVNILFFKTFIFTCQETLLMITEKYKRLNNDNTTDECYNEFILRQHI
jgi:hypothetical protein